MYFLSFLFFSSCTTKTHHRHLRVGGPSSLVRRWGCVFGNTTHQNSNLQPLTIIICYPFTHGTGRATQWTKLVIPNLFHLWMSTIDLERRTRIFLGLVTQKAVKTRQSIARREKKTHVDIWIRGHTEECVQFNLVFFLSHAIDFIVQATCMS